jgi:hypothetical protein
MPACQHPFNCETQSHQLDMHCAGAAPAPAGEKEAGGEGESKEHHHHGGLRGLVSSAVNTVKEGE